MAANIPDDHLSSSRLNMFMRCGMQYYFRYCEGRIAPPSGAMSLGSSFHVAIGYNYAQKLESHEDMKTAELLDAFSTDFDERMHETALYDGEFSWAFKDQGVGLLREYHQVISPGVQPSSVEREFEIPFENKSWTFTGRIDMVDKDNTIVEAKTIGSTPPRPKSDHLLQTTGYTAGLRSEGSKEKGARIDYAVKNKTPKVVSYPFKVADAQVEFFLGQVARAAHMIENEMFLPNRNHMYCSHRMCGYATRCEQICKGIVPER